MVVVDRGWLSVIGYRLSVIGYLGLPIELVPVCQ